MSNAHEVLAAAMGRTAPLPPVQQDVLPIQDLLITEPTKAEMLQHAGDAIYWAGRTRNAAVALAVLLMICVLYILYSAYRRYRGPRLAPVPLSYKQQRHVLVNYTAGAQEKK